MDFLKSFLLPYPTNVNLHNNEVATDFYYVPPPPPGEHLYSYLLFMLVFVFVFKLIVFVEEDVYQTRLLRSRTKFLQRDANVGEEKESEKENSYIPKPYNEKRVWTAPKEDSPSILLTALASASASEDRGKHWSA